MSDGVPAPGLPSGLAGRPLAPRDARVVFELIAATQRDEIGHVDIEEADIVADWQRPSHDLGARSWGVFDGPRLVGYAEVLGDDRGDAAVHPDHRGRGLGTQLARWMQETARAEGMELVGMTVPQGSPGDRLLAALGYHVRWTSWVLELPQGRSIPERTLPAGWEVRTARTDEHRTVWTIVEDAFGEWAARRRESWEDFSAEVMQRPGFEPWHVRVVTDPEGEVAGAVVVLLAGDCAYVDKLAVRRDLRHRGLAQALLVDAFATARGRGATRSELSTDSRTGALGLYERVGMVVSSTWLHRAIAL